MKEILIRYKYLFILLIFALLTHLNWFDFYNILTYSDWYYWPNEAVKQLFSSYGSWVNFWNFGSVNIQLQFNVFKFLWALLTNIGLSYDQAVKLTFLFPIAILGFFSPYFLSKKLFNDNLISFTTALFYGTTTHFLIRQTQHLTIAFIYSITPLIFLLFIYVLEKNKLSHCILFSLIYSIAVGYETRIMYIVTFILFIYFLFFYIRRWSTFYKKIILTILIITLLNLFWILPIFLGGGFSDASAAFNRGLFGNDLFSLTKSFTIFESSWTGAYPNMFFVPQKINWYFWTFPIIAFLALITSTRDKYKKEVLFFSLIALIGIFITKQSAPPFPSFYQWMYSNFPGFNMFREASKFYLVTSIGYLGLIGYSLVSIKNHLPKKKLFFYSIVFIIILLLFLNAKPLVTGEIGTMFVPREIPQDYLVLKDNILKQPDYFRTYWVPTDSRWGFYSNTHPRISGVSIIQSSWREFDEGHDNLQGQIMGIFKRPDANQLFDSASIKYVVVPLRDTSNDDDIYIHYGNNRDFYIQELNQVQWLQRIDIGTKILAIYENVNYWPHILANNATTQAVNPTEYRISFQGIKDQESLFFGESFHPDWKLYLKPLTKNNWCKPLKEYQVATKSDEQPEMQSVDTIKIKECRPIQNFAEGDELKYLWQSSIFDNTHKKANEYANSWTIDPEYIVRNYPSEYYKQNPDGSIDFELTLFFKPQSYLYIGFIISGLTLIWCFGYLVWSWKK